MSAEELNIAKELEDLLQLKPFLLWALSGLDTVNEHTNEIFEKRDPEITISLGQLSIIIQHFQSAKEALTEYKKKNNVFVNENEVKQIKK